MESTRELSGTDKDKDTDIDKDKEQPTKQQEEDELDNALLMAHQTPFLHSIPPSLLKPHLKKRTIKKSSTLIRQGTSSQDIFLIQSGTCSVFREQENKNQTKTLVQTLGPGQLAGELSFLYDRLRTASFVADNSQDLIVWEVTEKSLHKLAKQVAEFRHFIEKRAVVREIVLGHRLFDHLHLAEEQTLLSLSAFRSDTFAPGTVIMQQGDPISGTSRCFFLLAGNCEVWVSKLGEESKRVASLQSGDCFGELALLYSTDRTATVKAVGDREVEVLSLERHQFDEMALKGNKELFSLFEEYSGKEYGGVSYMSPEDFRRALSSEQGGNMGMDKTKMDMLFQVADKTGSGYLSFSEFALLSALLLKDGNPEYRIAFHFVDNDNSGYISGEQLRQAISSVVQNKKLDNSSTNSHSHKLGQKIPEIPSKNKTHELFQRDRISFDEFLECCTNSENHAFTLPDSLRHYLEFWGDLRSLSESCLHDLVDMESEFSNFTVSSDPKGTSAILHGGHKYLIAGGIAGAISRTCVSPLIRLKMLMQVQGNPPIITGVGQGLRYMIAKDGYKGLWRGNGTNIIRIAPTTAMQFFTFEILKSMLRNGEDRELHVLERLLAGGLAGTAAAVLTYPLDFIRARLTIQMGDKPRYKGIVHGMSTVVRKEGVFALYRGLWPTMVGVFPYIGVDFAVYETLKPYAPKIEGTHQTTSLGLLVVGGIAGGVSQTLAFPLELIRRRLQVQGFVKNEYDYNGGIWDALKKTVKKDGVKGLYRGLVPNYLKAVPSIGIGFLVYERMKTVLGLEPS